MLIVTMSMRDVTMTLMIHVTITIMMTMGSMMTMTMLFTFMINENVFYGDDDSVGSIMTLYFMTRIFHLVTVIW